MKIVERLELYFGITTFVTALLLFLYTVLFRDTENSDATLREVLVRGFLFLVFPSLFVFVGSYIHTVKQNSIGLILLFAFGSILVCVYGFFFLVAFLIGSVIEVSSFIWLLPTLFALITVIFALYSKNKYRAFN